MELLSQPLAPQGEELLAGVYASGLWKELQSRRGQKSSQLAQRESGAGGQEGLGLIEGELESRKACLEREPGAQHGQMSGSKTWE